MISDPTIAAAADLLGVSMTPQERALLPNALAAARDAAIARRAIPLPHDLAPAETFDPRPRGWIPPPIEAPFVQPIPPPPTLPGAEAGIAFAPATHLAGWLRSGAITSVRLTAIYLDRIARLDRRLLSWATLTPDIAMAQARAADAAIARGGWRGPLHGIPYGAKDILDTAGIETAWGAEPFRGRIPQADATSVARMRAAGAVLLGKTTVGALAMGDVWYGGRTRTPWDPFRGASGSSAGSCAAVAAGLCGFALGTETMGSIVEPSARCGTYGLRPTFGRVPRTGAMPLVSSLDKIGPVTRAVADLAPIMAALSGPDGIDPTVSETAFGTTLSPRVGYFAEDGRPDLPLDMIELTRPDLPYHSLMALLDAECAAVFEHLTLSNADDELSQQHETAWPNQFRAARFLSAVDHVQLGRFRRTVAAAIAGLFETVDVIAGAAVHGPLQIITNFSGHPCLVMPIRPGAPPDSLALYGRLFDEGTLVRLAATLAATLANDIGRPPGFDLLTA